MRVNSLSPGAIATIAEFYAPVQPLPRVGLPAAIAALVPWLASGRSTFGTGADVGVDGGPSGGRNFSRHQDGLNSRRPALGLPALGLGG